MSFAGGLPPRLVLSNLGQSVDVDPIECFNIIRDSMRDITEFADCLASPAMEGNDRKHHGITEVKREGVTSHHEVKLRPKFDVRETKQGFMLIGSMPGLRKEDLSIEIIENPDGRVLAISGDSNVTSRDPSPARDGSATESCPTPRLRTSYAKFEHRVRIPKHIDTATLQAKYEDGLLSITMSPLAKTDLHQRQKIAIH
jgi:HSP20 family molecular chaperone IbpA